MTSTHPTRNDPATGNFTDENGASVSIHDIRSRITEGLTETKNDGTPDPFRVGEASLRRYLGATRPALENADGLTAYSADNSGHLAPQRSHIRLGDTGR